MAKINLKRYEQWLSFLEDTLYISRNHMNDLFHEAGSESFIHNFAFRLQDIREDNPTAELDAAHQLEVTISVQAPVTLYERLRAATSQINSQLIDAAKMGLQLDLSQHVLWLDEFPEDENEQYTGRFAYVLGIDAPNIVTEPTSTAV